MSKEKEFLNKIREVYRQIYKLLYSEDINSDQEVLDFCENLLKPEHSFSERRAALDALKQVSDERFFKQIMNDLRKSCEDEIGKKLY